MKKIVSVILTVVMLLTMVVPAFGASTADDCVNIYLLGYGSAIYNAEGEKIYDVDLDLVNGLKEILDQLLIDLAKGKLTGDYDAYCDKIYNLIAPAYAELKLDPNGEATDGSGRGKSPLEMTNHKNNLWTGGYYRFDYDWRLSSEYNGALLEEYIDIILAKTGASKVNLIGRCLGGNVISAYLENASEESLSKVNKTVMYIPSTKGVDFIGDLFTGEIELDDETLDKYVTYTLPYIDAMSSDEGSEFSQMLKVCVNFFNQVKVLGISVDAIQDIYDDVKDNIMPRILRDTYASFPSFWSMIEESRVETAIQFIYNTPELQQEYAGLIAKARSFRENVQLNADETMTQLVANGMDMMVISKYNFAGVPLSRRGLANSDSTASTKSTSFGATTANIGEVLSKEYLKNVTNENAKYISPDKIVDSSTCLFPEKTWIIKNLTHAIFPDSVDILIDTFLVSDDMNIDTYEEYPQYLDFDKATDTLTPVEGSAEERPSDTANKISIFANFLKLILDLIKRLFSGSLVG